MTTDTSRKFLTSVSAGKLTGSPVEEETSAFLWVFLPIVAVPWGYVFTHYVYQPKHKAGPLNRSAA